jgi:hypothetical protein
MRTSTAETPTSTGPNAATEDAPRRPMPELGLGWLVLRDCALGGGGPRVKLALLHPNVGVALVDADGTAPDAEDRLRRALDARRFPAIFGDYPPIVRVVLPASRSGELGRVLAAEFEARPPLALAGGDAWIGTARAAVEAELPVAVPVAVSGRHPRTRQRRRAPWRTAAVLATVGGISAAVLALVHELPAAGPGGAASPAIMASAAEPGSETPPEDNRFGPLDTAGTPASPQTPAGVPGAASPAKVQNTTDPTGPAKTPSTADATGPAKIPSAPTVVAAAAADGHRPEPTPATAPAHEGASQPNRIPLAAGFPGVPGAVQRPPAASAGETVAIGPQEAGGAGTTTALRPQETERVSAPLAAGEERVEPLPTMAAAGQERVGPPPAPLATGEEEAEPAPAPAAAGQDRTEPPPTIASAAGQERLDPPPAPLAALIPAVPPAVFDRPTQPAPPPVVFDGAGAAAEPRPSPKRAAALTDLPARPAPQTPPASGGRKPAAPAAATPAGEAGGNGGRCREILVRATMGGSLSEGDREFLRRGCQPRG